MALPLERLTSNAPDASLRHAAHHIADLPDADTAALLLETINNGTCAFSPAIVTRPLVLYGAGNMGKLARDHLRVVGLDFAMVVDRQAEKLVGLPAWEGVLICRPEDVPVSVKQDSLLAVSVATSPYAPLEAALLADGWAHVVPFYDLAEAFRDRHPLSNGWFARPLDAAELATTRDVLAGWDDDISRAHHLQFIAWRRLRQEWTFAGAPVPDCARYFIPEIAALLTGTETVLDIGAHHGSVIEAFIRQSGGRFAGLLAVEPDADNYRQLERFVGTLAPDLAARIVLKQVAIDAQVGVRRFHSGLGYTSQFSQTGQTMIETTTIDALDTAPSFMKVHLEGGELDALKGALVTIERHRPVIAVTTYHNDDGIFRTPAFLMETLKDYRFLTRLHSWCGTGAVVYAIPLERHG